MFECAGQCPLADIHLSWCRCLIFSSSFQVSLVLDLSCGLLRLPPRSPDSAITSDLLKDSHRSQRSPPSFRPISARMFICVTCSCERAFPMLNSTITFFLPQTRTGTVPQRPLPCMSPPKIVLLVSSALTPRGLGRITLSFSIELPPFSTPLVAQTSPAVPRPGLL